MGDERRPAPATTPRTAAVWQALGVELERRAAGPLRVVDVGGGTGGFAVPLAEHGHHVTVVDASPNALAALRQRAAERGVAERVTAVQGDADRLLDVVATDAADLVLCHSVLELVDDPAVALGAVAAALRRGGAASVLVANRVAAALTRALGGHFGASSAVLTDPAGRVGGEGVLRRYDLDGIRRQVTGAGLTVERVHGVRVVSDLVPGGLVDAEGVDELVAWELAVASRSPYRDIATQLHVLARRE
jgi:S-adenosylmethionine-dependent methyltransferase